MTILKTERLEIRVESDVVIVRQTVRAFTQELGFGVVDQTKMVTAASELARNALIHGGGGSVTLEVVQSEGGKRGLRLTFEDQGPGIPDLEQAMKDGFTTRGGMGLGLGGSKRLVNEFELQSQPGVGTRVTVARWR